MDIDKRELYIVPPSMVVKAATAALIALALLAFVAAFKGFREYKYIGAGISAANTINISGEGEVFAVPDIATFSVSVTEEAKDVADAQRAAAEKTNAIIAKLRENGVEERDIKTADYNVYPRYEYRETTTGNRIVSSGSRELVGFEVTQSLRVKVRDTEKAGAILAEVGSLGATNVSGLTFTIDDEDTLRASARAMAIADAQAKAETLARDLGVDIVRVVGFYENEGGYPQPYNFARESSFDVSEQKMIAPDLPVGENKIVSQVNVTYEIR